MTAEVFAYGSLATEFGNGYHFIAESDALKRDEKSRAALGTLCNTIGQTGDPGRTVYYAASIREERGWWVWLRGVPQQDWQGRQGIFIGGVAVRWSEALAQSEKGAPWTIPWSALPFPDFADIKRTLEQAPHGKYREGYFMPPGTLEVPRWPGLAAAQLLDERLPALLVGARKLAEGGNYHLLNEPTAEDLVTWLALLQPPAKRSGFSYVINAPPRLSWQPRLVFWGEADETPVGEKSRLWGRSPAMPPAGAGLAAMFQGRRARGELSAAAFRATADITTSDTYWRTLVEQDRWAQFARHPERIDLASAGETAGYVRYVGAGGDGSTLRRLGRRLAERPERLAAVMHELSPDGAQHRSALLETIEPVVALEKWLPALRASSGLCEILWQLWQGASDAAWASVGGGRWLQIPAPECYRWIGRAAMKSPALLADPQIQATLLQMPPVILATETAERLIESCFVAGGKTALLPWQSLGLRQCLRDSDVPRLPLEMIGPAEKDLVEHREGPKSLSWVLAIWRAAEVQGRRRLWLTAARWIAPRLHHYSAEHRVEVLRGISARANELPPDELDYLQRQAAIAISEVKEPTDRAAAWAAWPILAGENVPDLKRRRPERGHALSSSPAWIKWAVASTLLAIALGGATWWWSRRPIPNLAELEARNISSAGEKGRSR